MTNNYDAIDWDHARIRITPAGLEMLARDTARREVVRARWLARVADRKAKEHA